MVANTTAFFFAAVAAAAAAVVVEVVEGVGEEECRIDRCCSGEDSER